jgi:hypothetical protein
MSAQGVPMPEDQAMDELRDLVERYRRSVGAMNAEDSAHAATVLSQALRALERARSRDTLSDDVAAADAILAVKKALGGVADPY